MEKNLVEGVWYLRRKHITDYISQLRNIVNTCHGELMFDRGFKDIDSKLVNLLNESQQFGISVEAYWNEYWDIIKPLEEQLENVLRKRIEACKLEGKIGISAKLDYTE